MVFGLTDTEKSHDSLKRIVDFQKKNEELTQKLLEQYQNNKELEILLDDKKAEIEKLKKQIAESDYSFAKGGANGNSIIRPENFNLEASSIE